MANSYSVGYGKPPEGTRFKPGQSGNPKGRPKKSTSLINVLEEPVFMKVDSKKREVSAFEASLRKTAQSALEGHLTAIKRFFNYCDEAGLLVDRDKQQNYGAYQVPINPELYPYEDWTEAKLAEIESINSTLNRPTPTNPPTEKQAIIMRVAGEKHFIEKIGQRMSVFQLIQQKLRHRALVERHQPSHAFFEKILTRSTLDIEYSKAKRLVVPAPMPAWLSPLRIEDVDTGEQVIPPAPGEPGFKRENQFEY